MKTKTVSVPKQLQGKVIAITGIKPGVGKSYSVARLSIELINSGFSVKCLGTTNKAAANLSKEINSTSTNLNIRPCTVVKFTKAFEETKMNGVDAFYVPAEPIPHPQTSAFIIIDEAFMMSNVMLNSLKKAYPKCCIILSGDPLQFKPIPTYVSRNGEILYQDAGEVISDVDYTFNLDVCHRTNSKKLLSALEAINSGDAEKVLEYITSKVTSSVEEEVDLGIEECGTHFLTDKENTRISIAYTKAQCNQNNTARSRALRDVEGSRIIRISKTYISKDIHRSFYKGELFIQREDGLLQNVENSKDLREAPLYVDPSDDSIELPSDVDIYTVRNEDRELFGIRVDESFFEGFTSRGWSVNAHKLQGATLKDVYVDIDLRDVERWCVKGDGDALQKFLYVAISRACDDEHVTFPGSREVVALIDAIRTGTITLKPMVNGLLNNANSMDSTKFVEDVAPLFVEFMTREFENSKVTSGGEKLTKLDTIFENVFTENEVFANNIKKQNTLKKYVNSILAWDINTSDEKELKKFMKTKLSITESAKLNEWLGFVKQVFEAMKGFEVIEPKDATPEIELIDQYLTSFGESLNSCENKSSEDNNTEDDSDRDGSYYYIDPQVIKKN